MTTAAQSRAASVCSAGKQVPFPADLAFVVASSGFAAAKTGSAMRSYNDAAASAAAAASALGFDTLGPRWVPSGSKRAGTASAPVWAEAAASAVAGAPPRVQWVPLLVRTRQHQGRLRPPPSSCVSTSLRASLGA